jgi:hypothetical protein
MILDEIEKRVKILEDIEEIKQLHIQYVLFLSEQRFEDMIECFAEDARIEGLKVEGVGQTNTTHNGKTVIAELMRGMAARQREIKYWKGGQFLVHPIISVEGDKATGCWTWFRIGMPSKFTSELGREIMLEEPQEARYDMEYKRINGKWKMSVMRFAHTWPQNPPPGEVHTITWLNAGKPVPGR